MYKISKEFHFSASHQLDCLPEDHPCSRHHGHNYIVIAHLQSMVLNEASMVDDYRSLQPMKEWIDNTLDHYHLNDICPFNPTAENLAKWLFDMFSPQFPNLYAISVKETPKTCATYTPLV